jgi:D-galactarolactone cycloisomerase
MIERIDVHVYRHVVERPVVTSFGIMRDRPAVFVRVEDRDGAFGWGEIFANWPAAGAEHRAHLLMEDIADLVIGAQFTAPSDLYRKLTRETHIRALQCGEWGPFRHVIAGLDIATWDLFARRAGMPLRNLLKDTAVAQVPAYASGIDIKRANEAITSARDVGFNAYKVKVGFDLESDAAAVNSLAGALAPEERLSADANQAWNVKQAIAFMDKVAHARLRWLEEPIPADAPAGDWHRLKQHGGIPLAGGENIAGLADFTAAIAAGALSVIQPDVAKWGGFTDCVPVARAAIAAGRTYCPHFLGGGIGLLASAHLLAAVGGDGVLEVDVNPNPLRDGLAPITESLKAGVWHLSDAPGLGIETLPRAFDALRTLHAARRL